MVNVSGNASVSSKNYFNGDLCKTNFLLALFVLYPSTAMTSLYAFDYLHVTYTFNPLYEYCPFNLTTFVLQL